METGKESMTPGRVRAARTIAVAADLVQILVLPVFAPGAASPWNDALDVLVAGAMALLIGWHWVFLPSFLAELVPGFDLVPTWTAAVFFATRGKGRPSPAGVCARNAIDTEVISSTPGARPASVIRRLVVAKDRPRYRAFSPRGRSSLPAPSGF